VSVTLAMVPVTGVATTVTGIRQVEGGEAPRFDIRTDQPVTYEAYPMPQVLRYVVDLHNVEPGMVSNLTKLDTPSVKRVLLQQKNLNGLQMTRVIFDLSREMIGRVVVDEGGRRLLVAFSPPLSKSLLVATASPAAYPATPMPVPTATVANNLPPMQKKGLVPVVPTVPVPPAVQPRVSSAVRTVEPVTPAAAQAPVPVSAPQQADADRKGPPRIEAVKVEKDGILVEISGNYGAYTAFTMKSPGRLIIDFPPGSTTLGKPMPVNRFGVRTLRIGLTPQRMRIVLEAGGEVIVPYEISRVSSGLKILFPDKK